MSKGVKEQRWMARFLINYYSKCTWEVGACLGWRSRASAPRPEHVHGGCWHWAAGVRWGSGSPPSSLPCLSLQLPPPDLCCWCYCGNAAVRNVKQRSLLPSHLPSPRSASHWQMLPGRQPPRSVGVSFGGLTMHRIATLHCRAQKDEGGD